MDEVTFGQYALPVLLTVLLGFLYKFVSIPDKFKAGIAVICGMGLGILGIVYNGIPWSAVNIIDHLIYGFMMGAAAIGIYEVTRTKLNPRGFFKFPSFVILFIISLALLLVVSGCASLDKIFPPPPAPVCERPEAINSVFCKEFRKRGIEPELYEDMFLFGIAVGAIIEPRVASTVKIFVSETRRLMKNSPLLTVGSLFTWVQENEQKSKAIAGLINHKFPWLKDVHQIMDSFDVWLVEKHLEHIEQLL